MLLVIGLLLAVGCVAVVLLPFLRARAGADAFSLQDASLEVELRRQATYDEIRTLRLEYELSNIPEEEYQTRFRLLRLQAAATLRDQQRLELALQEFDRELEAEIASFHDSTNGAEPPSPP